MNFEYIQFFTKYFHSISSCVNAVEQKSLVNIAELIAGRSGKVIIAGNGGSAAMASHVTVDLLKAAGIRTVNFNEADLITCFANDYGYENWVVKALEAYGDPGDITILISSSGQSLNIIKAATFARQNRLPIVTLSGFDIDNPLRKLGDINLWADSKSYNIVEMTHHIWLLSVVDYIVSGIHR
jgi:D-sedoheptulose 7-phosphate isomerase